MARNTSRSSTRSMRQPPSNRQSASAETPVVETPFKRCNDDIALAQENENNCCTEYNRAIARLNDANPLDAGYGAARDRARNAATELANARERLRLCLNGQNSAASTES